MAGTNGVVKKSGGATTTKDLPSRQSRSKQKEILLSSDPTRDYQSTRFSYFGELLVQKLPPWRLWTGRIMLSSDPIVNLMLNVRNAALMPGEVTIKAKKPEVQQWLEKQWSFLWNEHRLKMVSAKKFGFAPLQVNWKLCNGLLDIKSVKDFQPEDCRALEARGKLVGHRVKGNRIYFPRALWLTYNAEYGSAYGTGCLRKAYPPWYEKWMDRGAKRLLQLRMIKDAYIGDIYWYPAHLSLTLPDGKKIAWADLMREQGENRLSGGAQRLPRMYDDKGRELTGYTPPQDVGGGSQIFEWINTCDEGILWGGDIPSEVIKAESTGSGYSGRSIPFLVLLSNCTNEFAEIVQRVDEQILRPGAWLNFGGDPEYEIVPRSLVESFSDDTRGSAMGGSAIGSPASAAPPPPPPAPPSSKQYQEGYERWIKAEQFKETKFSSTQFNLPSSVAEQVIRLGATIPDSDLAEDGRETEPHITIKYGLHTDKASDVLKALFFGEGTNWWQKPVTVTLGPTTIFSGEKHDVVKIDVIGKDIHELNDRLTKSLSCTDTYPEYKPHVTIAYVKKGLGPKYAAKLTGLRGTKLTFDHFSFSDKERRHTVIPLFDNEQFAERSHVEGIYHADKADPESHHDFHQLVRAHGGKVYPIKGSGKHLFKIPNHAAHVSDFHAAASDNGHVHGHDYHMQYDHDNESHHHLTKHGFKHEESNDFGTQYYSKNRSAHVITIHPSGRWTHGVYTHFRKPGTSHEYDGNKHEELQQHLDDYFGKEHQAQEIKPSSQHAERTGYVEGIYHADKHDDHEAHNDFHSIVKAHGGQSFSHPAHGKHVFRIPNHADKVSDFLAAASDNGHEHGHHFNMEYDHDDNGVTHALQKHGYEKTTPKGLDEREPFKSGNKQFSQPISVYFRDHNDHYVKGPHVVSIGHGLGGKGHYGWKHFTYKEGNETGRKMGKLASYLNDLHGENLTKIHPTSQHAEKKANLEGIYHADRADEDSHGDFHQLVREHKGTIKPAGHPGKFLFRIPNKPHSLEDFHGAASDRGHTNEHHYTFQHDDTANHELHKHGVHEDHLRRHGYTPHEEFYSLHRGQGGSWIKTDDSSLSNAEKNGVSNAAKRTVWTHPTTKHEVQLYRDRVGRTNGVRSVVSSHVRYVRGPKDRGTLIFDHNKVGKFKAHLDRLNKSSQHEEWQFGEGRGVEKLSVYGGRHEILVHRNFPLHEAQALMQKHGKLRGVHHLGSNTTWLWDASKAHHEEVAKKLGLRSYKELNFDDGNRLQNHYERFHSPKRELAMQHDEAGDGGEGGDSTDNIIGLAQQAWYNVYTKTGRKKIKARSKRHAKRKAERKGYEVGKVVQQYEEGKSERHLHEVINNSRKWLADGHISKEEHRDLVKAITKRIIAVRRKNRKPTQHAEKKANLEGIYHVDRTDHDSLRDFHELVKEHKGTMKPAAGPGKHLFRIPNHANTLEAFHSAASDRGHNSEHHYSFEHEHGPHEHELHKHGDHEAHLKKHGYTAGEWQPLGPSMKTKTWEHASGSYINEIKHNETGHHQVSIHVPMGRAGVDYEPGKGRPVYRIIHSMTLQSDDTGGLGKFRKALNKLHKNAQHEENAPSAPFRELSQHTEHEFSHLNSVGHHINDLRKVQKIGSFYDVDKFHDHVLRPMHNHGNYDKLHQYAAKKPKTFSKLRIASLHGLWKDSDAHKTHKFGDFLNHGTVTAYRGVQEGQEHEGSQWSLRHDVARTFAQHGARTGLRGEPGHGTVHKAEIPVRHIKFYSNQQGENEIVTHKPISGALHSQHEEETEQFEETEALKKLREFIAKGTAARIKSARERIEQLKATRFDFGTIAGEVEREMLALRPMLADDLASARYQAYVWGVADVASELPPDVVVRLKTYSTAVVAPVVSPVAPLVLPGHSKPSAVLPALDDALSVLLARPVAVGATYLETAERVRAGSFAITGDLTTQAVGEVRDELATAIREGKSQSEFIDAVLAKFDEGKLSESHLETVFRTNVMAAYSDGQLAAVSAPIVKDHFPYAAYSATWDRRVRPEHRELESLGLQGTNLYRSDDPTFLKFRPPWSYNCRCAWTPATVEQAARKGVKEAQEWMDAARRLAETKGGSFYDHLNAAAPSSHEFVTPPPFEPPPGFVRDF